MEMCRYSKQCAAFFVTVTFQRFVTQGLMPTKALSSKSTLL